MTTTARDRLRAQQEAAARRARTTRIALVGGIVLLCAVVAFVLAVVVPAQIKKKRLADGPLTPPNATQTQDAVVVNPGKAKADAPVLSIYFDYQCPVCKQFELAVGDTIEQMAATGEVQLQYHGMTFLDTKLKNDSSVRAGVAAACADVLGAYPAYHDAVFAGQPESEGVGYTDQQLRSDFAATAGITGDNLTKFQQCYDKRQTQGFVDAMNEKSFAAGVTGTPTVYVNGKQFDLSGITDNQDFRAKVLAAGK